MDSQEMIRAITDLSRKDIQAITFKKGSKEHTWSIKLAAPVQMWTDLIKKIEYINDRLKNLARIEEAPPPEKAIDINYSADEEIVVIELSKYATGNYGWEVRVSKPDSLIVIEQANKVLEQIFS